MALKTFTLALALAGIAASLYAGRRRSWPPDRPDRPDRSRMGGADTVPPVGTDSPNASQRLQQEKLAGPAASGWAAGSEGDDLFSSSSQQSERPAGTGLPDFTRGA